MINKLSTCITEKLFLSGTIRDEDKELYIYGLFMLLSQFMFFIITCIIGLVLKCVSESIIFYIAFQLLRKYAGGYHASTEARCEILTTLSIMVCIVVIRMSKTYNLQTLLLTITIISAVCIFVFCPLDTPEKPLSDKEFKYFRVISRLILLVIIAVIAVTYIFESNLVFVPCCLSIILESILLIAGKIKRNFYKKQL